MKGSTCTAEVYPELSSVHPFFQTPMRFDAIGASWADFVWILTPFLASEGRLIPGSAANDAGTYFANSLVLRAGMPFKYGKRIPAIGEV